MSKFIKVTEQACGEERIIFTSSISEIVRDEDKGSIVYYNDDSRFFTKESLEQIEAQLLRDEFAKEIAGSLFSRSDLNIWEHIVRDNAQSHTQKRIIEESYKIADLMLKERSK